MCVDSIGNQCFISVCEPFQKENSNFHFLAGAVRVTCVLAAGNWCGVVIVQWPSGQQSITSIVRCPGTVITQRIINSTRVKNMRTNNTAAAVFQLLLRSLSDTTLAINTIR